MKSCECGCGELIDDYGKGSHKKEIRHYKKGHTSRGRRDISGSNNPMFGVDLRGPANPFFGHKHSEASLKLLRGPKPSIRDEKHYRWAGKDVSYGALHDWLKKHWPDPKPDKCSICKLGLCKLELCNIRTRRNKQTYNRDFNNWFWACHLCHMDYDGNRYFYRTGVVIRDEKTGQFRRGNP